ncbi:hypothetical protein BN1723_007623, partial [Verticillium longisporum]
EGPSPPVFCQFGAALAGGTALSHLETPVRRVHGDVMPRRHQDNTTRPVLCSMLVLSPHARSHVRSHARSSWSVLRSQFMSRGEDRVLQWPDMYHIRKHRAEQQLSLKKHPRQGRYEAAWKLDFHMQGLASYACPALPTLTLGRTSQCLTVGHLYCAFLLHSLDPAGRVCATDKRPPSRGLGRII